MSADGSLTLSEDLQAPAHARAWTAARTPHLPPTTVEDLLLVVSELVTNAVRHGRPAIVLNLRLLVDRVRVEVSDGHTDLPVIPGGRPAQDRPGGRGLLIVAATALDWGVDLIADGAGKTIWAEVAVPTGRP